MRTRTKLLWAALALVGLIVLALLGATANGLTQGDYPSAKLARWSLEAHTPEDAIRMFEVYPEPHYLGMDPLILCKCDVTGPLLRAIEAGTLEKRWLAIKFLGNQRNSAALPLLSRIVMSEQEDHDARAAALVAVATIDREKARVLIERLAIKPTSNQGDALQSEFLMHVQQFSSELASGAWSPEHERGWLQAFIESALGA